MACYHAHALSCGHVHSPVSIPLHPEPDQQSQHERRARQCIEGQRIAGFLGLLEQPWQTYFTKPIFPTWKHDLRNNSTTTVKQ